MNFLSSIMLGGLLSDQSTLHPDGNCLRKNLLIELIAEPPPL